MTAQQRKTMAVLFMIGIIVFIGILLKKQMGKQEAQKKAAEEKLKAEREKLKRTMPVVFASRDIEKRRTITKEDVKIVDVPEHDFPKLDYVTSIEEVVGQMALVDIYSREAILRARVAGKDKVTSLSFLVPKGMRAISVNINTVDACGGFLNQGDIVDILATFRIDDPSRPGTNTTVSTDLLQNVKVLAVNKDYLIGDSKDENSDEEEKEEKEDEKKKTGSLKAKEKVSMVTLLLSPEDAEKIVVASSTAKIKMILPAQTAQIDSQPRKRTVVTAKDIQDDNNSSGFVRNSSNDDESGKAPEMVEVKVIRAGKKYQRFMPYEEAKREAAANVPALEDDWIEPDGGWDDSDDLSGVSLPEF